MGCSNHVIGMSKPGLLILSSNMADLRSLARYTCQRGAIASGPDTESGNFCAGERPCQFNQYFRAVFAALA